MLRSLPTLCLVLLVQGCQKPALPCPTDARSVPARPTLLVRDVVADADAGVTVTAVAFNLGPLARLVTPTGEGVPATWSDRLDGKPLLSGSVVTFSLREKTTVHVESDGADPSTEVSWEPPRLRFERPAVPDLQLVSMADHGFRRFWVPLSTPGTVRLYDGRDRPLPDDAWECVPETSPWLSDFVSVCEVWFYDAKDGVGFHGSRVQAVVDTASGAVVTKRLTLR